MANDILLTKPWLKSWFSPWKWANSAWMDVLPSQIKENDAKLKLWYPYICKCWKLPAELEAMPTQEDLNEVWQLNRAQFLHITRRIGLLIAISASLDVRRLMVHIGPGEISLSEEDFTWAKRFSLVRPFGISGLQVGDQTSLLQLGMSSLWLLLRLIWPEGASRLQIVLSPEECMPFIQKAERMRFKASADQRHYLRAWRILPKLISDR